MADPGLIFYGLVMLFRTTPLLWAGWVMAAAACLVRPSRGLRTSWHRPALVLLAYALLYGLLMTLGGKKHDRYILPAFPALIALAALGYDQITSLRHRIPGTNWLLAAVVVIQVALVLSLIHI